MANNSLCELFTHINWSVRDTFFIFRKHQMCMNVQVGQTKSKMRGQGIVVPKKLKFKPLTRKGMSVCADHGWQKKGFDSLTGKKKP